MRYDILRCLAVPALALLAGCARGAATEPEAPPVGNFQLTAVQGEPLPFAFLATELIEGEIVAGTLTITADGRYTRDIRIRWILGVVEDTVQGFPRSGRVTRTGSELRFVSDEGLESVGTVNGEVVEKQARIETAQALRYTFRRGTGVP